MDIPLDAIDRMATSFEQMAKENEEKANDGNDCMRDWYDGRAKAYELVADSLRDLATIYRI